MNRFITYLLYGCIVAMAIGCTDTPAPECFVPTKDAHYLETDVTDLSYSANPETKHLSIHSSQNWAISEYADWLTMSQDVGSGDAIVSVSAAENFSADIVRTNIFYLKSTDEGWNFTHQMYAAQEAADGYITFSKNELILSGASSTNRIDIEANTEWEASCNAEWITLYPAADKSHMNISVAENHTSEVRTATVIFAGAVTRTLSVTQNVAEITTEEHTLEYPQAGGAYKLKINSEVAWTISVNESSSDWVDVSPLSGTAGECELTIAVTPNWNTSKRVASVRFCVGDFQPNNIVLKQEGLLLSADESVSFRALGETKSVQVESNIEWSVLSKPSWISVSPSTFSGSTSISLTADNNSDAANRSGVIVLGIEGVTHKAEINVSQAGKYFAVNNESIAFGSTGGVMDLTMTTNDSWNISLLNSADWLSLSQTSGEESLQVYVTAVDNPSVNYRSEVTRIKPRDSEAVDVIIRQEARYLTVSTNGVQFFSKGGTSEAIIISTDGKYEVSEQVDWLSFTQSGDVLYVSADVNNTGHIRTGNITIELTDLVEGALSLQIVVTQIAPGGVFGRVDYKTDDLWDAAYGNSFTISVIDYLADASWDENGNHGIVLKIEGYKNDDDWNGNYGSGNMDKGDYPTDDNYNPDNGSGNVGKGDYIDDDNYDNDEIKNN